ncbi:CCR4-NOT transcription complex subunit 3 [Carpediemonas membranifera]|uniref:CCR4-NOT transcription complex subunit 3 n=1 Tax=Carpediemonas membranifera TaxID=201153 RepID=A0A8J6AR11_9EUKA|nr:CCR4-NOT transcription complex subunit 3 [Carpediemonas membranifera]|eukprot:KAG9389945.1 CCR4-NOT transcription complex subunit 3 [Carpediemonas membranifera]
MSSKKGKKLNSEISLVLKRVKEGVERFNELYDAVYSTDGSSKQKDDALKREIKKLQRYRDQLKTWISSGEIRDNTALVNNRKLIESQMERYKIFERESKTKAFSREALSLTDDAGRRAFGQKAEQKQWVSSTIAELTGGITEYQEEIEKIRSRNKLKRSDKRMIDELEQRISQHRFHVNKLQLMTRALDQDDITVEDIDEIKDDVDYYVSSHDDPDYQPNPTLYEDIDNLMIGEGTRTEVKIEEEPQGLDKTIALMGVTSENSTPRVEVVSRRGTTTNVDGNINAKLEEITKRMSAPTTPVAQKKEKTKRSEPAVGGPKPARRPDTGLPPKAKPGPAPAVPPAKVPLPFAQVVSQTTTQPATQPPTPAQSQSQVPPSQPMTPQRSQSGYSDVMPPGLSAERETQPPIPKSESQSREANRVSPTVPTKEAATPALSEVDLPLSPAQTPQHPGTASREPVHVRERAALEFGLSNVTLSDVHKPRPYHPVRPTATPSYYPQTPMAEAAQFKWYKAQQLDTLFFVFYYEPNTYNQYLASIALKGHDWRFNKRFQTWMQRDVPRHVGEPGAPTGIVEVQDDFERGSYVYFDARDMWCVRKKREFTLMYRDMEGAGDGRRVGSL